MGCFATLVINKIDENEHVMIMFRVKYENSNTPATITQIKTINKTSKKDLFNYIKERMGLKDEGYKSSPIVSIILSYGIRKGSIIPDIMVENPNKDIKYQIYFNNKLPIATKPEDYGKVMQILSDTYLISLNSKTFIRLTIQLSKANINIIKIIDYNMNGEIR